jgi:transcriptional regulator with XRE-family HTH domain
MNYEIGDIIAALKSAREAKALSQRDLSARAGVPQSHISKIESGKVDLQLSSLVQLARLLDLEVKLVPKKALPAVDSVVRSTTAQAASKGTANVLNRLRQAEKVAETLRQALPENSELHRASTVLRELQNFQYQPPDLERLNAALKTYSDVSRKLAHIQKTQDAVRELAENADVFGKIRATTTTLQALRNQLVHTPRLAITGPKPAYDLDGDNA